jgi:hypothetical protein
MGRNRFRKGKKDHNKRVARRNELLSAKKERERLMFMEQLKALQEASLKEHDVDVIDVDELGDIGDIGDLVEELEEPKETVSESKSEKDTTS